MQKVTRSALIYTIVGLSLGVFYREFTKFNGFQGYTQLRGLHVHSLVLGAIFFLIVLMLDKQFGIGKSRRFSLWFVLYHIGAGGTIAIMLVRGIGQVLGIDPAGLNHIAGLFHTILGIALVWFAVMVHGHASPEAGRRKA